MPDSFERDIRAVRELTQGSFIIWANVWLAAERCGYKGRAGGKGGLDVQERFVYLHFLLDQSADVSPDRSDFGRGGYIRTIATCDLRMVVHWGIGKPHIMNPSPFKPSHERRLQPWTWHRSSRSCRLGSVGYQQSLVS